MKNFSLFIIFNLLVGLNLTADEFDGDVTALKKDDFLGEFLVKMEGYDQIYKACYQNTECMEGAGALALLMFSIKYEFTKAQFTMLLDESLMRDTLGYPNPEPEKIPPHVNLQGSWSYDEEKHVILVDEKDARFNVVGVSEDKKKFRLLGSAHGEVDDQDEIVLVRLLEGEGSRVPKSEPSDKKSDKRLELKESKSYMCTSDGDDPALVVLRPGENKTVNAKISPEGDEDKNFEGAELLLNKDLDVPIDGLDDEGEVIRIQESGQTLYFSFEGDSQGLYMFYGAKYIKVGDLKCDALEETNSSTEVEL